MKFILAQKKGMTQFFDNDGNVIPVTVVSAGPCPIVRVKKSEDPDGYNAAVIGLSGKKKLGKRDLGQTRGLGNLQFIKEFRLDSPGELKSGDIISVDSFVEGDKVKVVGTSKGKGFQGVVKRYGFHGQEAQHGNKDQERAPGSIGPCEPARVFPGIRMAGHMGNARVTVKNLIIAKINSDSNELYIKGAIPGAKGGLLLISCDGELKVNLKKDQENNSIDSVKENKEETTEKETEKLRNEETDKSAEEGKKEETAEGLETKVDDLEKQEIRNKKSDTDSE